jgi:hypothetical protein
MKTVLIVERDLHNFGELKGRIERMLCVSSTRFSCHIVHRQSVDGMLWEIAKEEKPDIIVITQSTLGDCPLLLLLAKMHAVTSVKPAIFMMGDTKFRLDSRKIFATFYPDWPAEVQPEYEVEESLCRFLSEAIAHERERIVAKAS